MGYLVDDETLCFLCHLDRHIVVADLMIESCFVNKNLLFYKKSPFKYFIKQYLNLNGLTSFELQELKLLLNYILKEKSIFIINKLKKDKFTKPYVSMYLMLQSVTDSKKEGIMNE